MKIAQRISQVVLGSALMYAGIGHLTTNRTEFQAQVPTILKSIAASSSSKASLRDV